ncbi:MAG TPA: 3-(methylthio)propionyl-CoA ligase [Rhodospirillales bacterium]|nr:3-(methylthio)propionyl-CoA ligase [Rhodospirillales bacterium]
MRGLMMDAPLLISSLIRFAAQNHATTEIVSRSVEGPIHRYTYADAYGRICRLARALGRLGVTEGDRVATLAWNGYRHFELYFGVSGIGAVCHTINPRLFHDQIEYVVNHAEDKYIFLDLTFVPLLEKLAPVLKPVKGYVIMTDAGHMPETTLPGALCYETLLEAEADTFEWPEFDENTASSLCYTSGTTGHPKGALYSHRSTLLHTFSICSADSLGLNCEDTMLPAVPMFHVNAWGIPYCCAMVGAKLVLPGPNYEGEAVYELLEDEQVTKSAGVPTIWLMLLDYMKKNGKKLPHLECTVIGGSAVPRSMIEAFQDDFGVQVFHAWGMTEMSPVGTTGRLKGHMRNLPKEKRQDIQLKQGRGIFGVEMKIVDDAGHELPRDGKAFGELMVRGPWVASEYYNDDEGTKASFTGDGWFGTGDVSTLDEDGFMQIVDRSKDVIKSGGEWISSIDLENTAVGHPDIAEAAVIGVAHPKWDERPILVVVPVEGKEPAPDDILAFLEDRVAKWWLPDDVVFVDEIPHTATGKISKMQLRERLKDYKLPDQ